jgi:hypothetical protein
MNRSFLKNLFTLFCLVAYLSISPAAFGQDAKPFVGTWNGSIEAGGQQIGIVVHFSTDDEGNIQGTIDVPNQGLAGLALSGFEIDGKKITFIIDGIPGEPTFKGELDEPGTKISGSFSQSGAEGSFSMEKE